MKVLSLLGLILVPFTAMGGTITSKLQQLSLATEQYANVSLVTAFDSSNHPCSNTSNFLSFDKTTEHGKQMYSLLLAAYLANREIYFEYSNTTCGLWGTQPVITRVDLRG